MFSTTVKIASLDDYIAPSQECVKPIMDKQKEGNKAKLLSVEDDPIVNNFCL